MYLMIEIGGIYIYDLFFFDNDFHMFVTYEFIFLTLAFGVLGYNADIPLLIYFFIMFFVYNREQLENEDGEYFDKYFLDTYKWLI